MAWRRQRDFLCWPGQQDDGGAGDQPRPRRTAVRRPSGVVRDGHRSDFVFLRRDAGRPALPGLEARGDTKARLD